MSQRNFIKARGEINVPFGKRSIFHNFYDDPIGATFPDDETPPKDKYTYAIIVCESGLEVFEKYKSGQYKPEPRHIYIFVEKKDSGKNNFFGTACRVKMGDERKELMWKLYDKETRISVHDDIDLAGSLEEWAEDISYFNRGTEKAIDRVVLANAVKLELSNKTDANKIFQTLFGLNDKLSDWIRSGVEAMDGWKFTEENYEFEKYGEKLKPIIPVNFFTKAPDFLYTGNKDKKVLEDSGIHALTQLSYNLDQIIFTKAYVLALSTPFVHDDILFGSVWLIKEFLEEHLPESLKTLFNKVKHIIAQARQFIQKIGKELQKAVAVYNAFLCGLANGLISLLQMVVWLVAYVIDNISFLEAENFSKEKRFEHQEKLEFIEDLLDIIQENISEIFNGLLTSLETLGEDIEAFAEAVGQKIGDLSRYWWAFIIGAVVFEVIVDAVFAFFTGGTSLAASVGHKITRLSTQLADKGIKAAQTGVKKIATSASSLYTSVKAFFLELIEAIRSGKFLTYLKEKLLSFLPEGYDDVISLLPENSLTVATLKVRINQINKALRKSTAVFNPEKPALKKLDIKLYKSKNKLSVDFSKTPKYLYGGNVSRKSVVRIKLKGSRELDKATAWKKAGFTDKQIEELEDLYTWHHLDDFNPITGKATMQLVEKEIHRQCAPHIGSVKQVEEFFEIKYKK